MKKWILQLVVLEIILAFVLGVVMGLLAIDIGSSVSIIAVMSAALGFGLHQENKMLAGKIQTWTPENKKKVALWTSIWVNILGTSVLAFLYLLGVPEFQAIPLYVLTVIPILGFLITWGAHWVSFKQANAIATKAYDKQKITK